MYKIPSGYINVAAVSSSTRALGPGERSVLWVQGCPFQCASCLAPDWIPFQESRQASIPELVEELLASPTVEGLTFSGGEPMMQAKALAVLAKLVRERREVNIITFSGFRYEKLLRLPEKSGVPELLSQIDVLVDGEYINSLNNGIGLRGSTNQRILHLTSRLANFDLENSPRRIEVQFSDREMFLIGIPAMKVHDSFQNALESPEMVTAGKEVSHEWI